MKLTCVFLELEWLLRGTANSKASRRGRASSRRRRRTRASVITTVYTGSIPRLAPPATSSSSSSSLLIEESWAGLRPTFFSSSSSFLLLFLYIAHPRKLAQLRACLKQQFHSKDPNGALADWKMVASNKFNDVSSRLYPTRRS